MKLLIKFLLFLFFSDCYLNAMESSITMFNEQANSDMRTDLINAILTDDFEKFHNLSTAGVQPNFRDFKGRTPLTFAVKKGKKAMVQMILLYNADINFPDIDGNTPIMVAIKRFDYELVKLLCDRNADFFIKNKSGESALDLINKYEKIYNIMQNDQTPERCTTSSVSNVDLSMACSEDYDNLQKAIMDVDVVDESENVQNNVIIISDDEQLQNKVDDQDAETEDDEEFLNEYRIALEKKRGLGQSDEAVTNSKATVDTLANTDVEIIETPTNITIAADSEYDERSNSPSAGSNKRKRDDAFGNEIDKTANYKVPRNERDTRPLWEKCLVKAPLESKKTINVHSHRISPQAKNNLIEAVKQGDLNKLKQVFNGLSSTSGVDTRDNDEKRLLHWAAELGHLDIMKFLVEEKRLTHIWVKDVWGRFPITYAIMNNKLDIITYLKSQCDFNFSHRKESVDINGYTLLMQIIIYGTEQIYDLIFGNKYYKMFNYTDNRGRTALMHAILHEGEDIVKKLLAKNSINIKQVDNQGKSALVHALEKGNIHIIKMLIEKWAHNGKNPKAAWVHLESINQQSFIQKLNQITF